MGKVVAARSRNKSRHNQLWRTNRNLIALEFVHRAYSSAEAIDVRGTYYRLLKKRKKQ